jgi:hypothetical protein
MAEQLHSQNEPEEPESSLESQPRYPTEEELRRFERVRDIRIGDLYPIEDFARNPEYPTEEEIQAMNDFNRTVPKAFEDLSFEDYFGYPDPRTPRHEDQADQHRPGGHEAT